MDFADLKNKNDKELRELLAEKRNAVRELRFKAGGKQLKDVRAIRAAKKDVARILTELRRRRNAK